MSDFNKITGWLAPNNEFIQCNLFEHIEIIRENKIFSKYVPKIDDIIQNIENIYDSCQSYADHGEHPEWHCYEMACDDARPEIRRLLLNAGFIRVGESKNGLHFEGRPNHLKTKHQRCKDFADSYAAEAYFEPQK